MPEMNSGFFRLPMALTPNATYYIRVRLRNGAGLFTAAVQSPQITYVPSEIAVLSSEGVVASVASADAQGSTFNARSLAGEPFVTGGGRNADGWPGNLVGGGSTNSIGHWAGFPEAIRTFTHPPQLLFQNPRTGLLGGFYRTQTGFRWKIIESSAGAAPTVALADLNGDGRVDALAQKNGLASAALFSGASLLERRLLFTIDPNLEFLGANDFDRDQRYDILARNVSTQGLYVLRASGGSAYLGTLPAGAKYVGLGDFDRDGDPDIAYQTAAGQSVVILRLEMMKRYGVTVSLPAPASGEVAGAVADVDGDGYPDIAYRAPDGRVIAAILDRYRERARQPVGFVALTFALVAGF
jgi:hypothetical protein